MFARAVMVVALALCATIATAQDRIEAFKQFRSAIDRHLAESDKTNARIDDLMWNKKPRPTEEQIRQVWTEARDQDTARAASIDRLAIPPDLEQQKSLLSAARRHASNVVLERARLYDAFLLPSVRTANKSAIDQRDQYGNIMRIIATDVGASR